MSVRELNRSQMLQLKQDYLCHVRNAGRGTSYMELVKADDLVGDETVIDYYDGFDFSEADFF